MRVYLLHHLSVFWQIPYTLLSAQFHKEFVTILCLISLESFHSHLFEDLPVYHLNHWIRLCVNSFKRVIDVTAVLCIERANKQTNKEYS